jgi:hypothetical protein
MIETAVELGLSLIAVLALGWLASWMDLGGDRRIIDEAHALKIADQGEYGFRGIDVAMDRAGCSALVRDQTHRHVLIHLKGNQFVTRLVDPSTEGRLDQKFLTLDFHQPDMDPVTLNLGDKAQYWASGLRHIPHV